MKTILAVLLLATTAFSQTPDPRDSVIIESKTAAPQSGPCASASLKIRVWITNKDSLAVIVLPLETNRISGDAYAVLSRPANCGSNRAAVVIADFIYPPGPGGGQRLPARFSNVNNYHSTPPDTFLWAGNQENPLQADDRVPPNFTRVPVIDIKFDSVTGLGLFQVDSGKVLANTVSFVDIFGTAIYVNFVKGMINVGGDIKGDLNKDFFLTPADVVLILNYIYLNIPPPAGETACDLNCDGIPTTADAIIEMNAVFLGVPFPC